jgi:tryptophan-rich sensory protein
MGSIPALIIFFVIVFAVGASGSFVSGGPWYNTIAKPPWTPPSWIFGPVWFVLYVSIAVAGWLVWRQVGLRPQVFAFFALQLVLNGLWSWAFFGAHRIGLALVNIVALWITILGTIITFVSVVPLAGWMLVPYILWVSFASSLNFAIWRLNA